jgi:hypothetical protein
MRRFPKKNTFHVSWGLIVAGQNSLQTRLVMDVRKEPDEDCNVTQVTARWRTAVMSEDQCTRTKKYAVMPIPTAITNHLTHN